MFVEREDLCESDFIDLINGQLLAVRIPEYYSSSDCEKAVKSITEFNTNDYYEVTKDLGTMKKIGKAIFDFADNPEEIIRYYDEVPNTKKLLNKLFHGFPPLAKLQYQLGELWRSGCEVDHFDYGNPMYYGLIRIFEKGSFALPHQDMTMWDYPVSERTVSIKAQFAVNVYLQVPEKGGQLVIYKECIRDRNLYESKKVPGTYGIDTSYIDNIDRIIIKPRKGDLIISNSQMIHEVTENLSSEQRITSSCFINYRSSSQPLCMFS